MKEQHTNTTNQGGGPHLIPKRENETAGKQRGILNHERHGDAYHQNPEVPFTSFDFGKTPVFPPSRLNPDLPHDLQANMESSFGQDFSGVNIHRNSQEALRLNALAYTQGESIHFAPGEFTPHSESGRNLIGHEFAHVVQQRSGVVNPTAVLGKGLALNNNQGLENEADRLGRKAVQGEVVEKYQSPSLGIRNSIRSPAQMKGQVIQLAKKTSQYGDFTDESYTTIKDSTGKEIGVEMYMKFKPGKNVDAEMIGLVQSVRSVEKGTPFAIGGDPTIKSRMITSKDAVKISSPAKDTDEGIQIDQHSGYRNPLYSTGAVASTDTKLSEASTPKPVSKMTAAEVTASPVTGKNYKGWGEHGYRYKSGKAWKEKDAELHDAPMLSTRTTDAEQLFETTALSIKGTQKSTYYGSVQWGWRTDSKGNFSAIPFELQSHGTPSSTFLKAAEIWNQGQSSAKEKNIPLPTEDVQMVGNFLGVNIGLGPVYTNLPFGTRVVKLPGFVSMTESLIKVVDGPYTGQTGQVKNGDLTDERN